MWKYSDKPDRATKELPTWAHDKWPSYARVIRGSFAHFSFLEPVSSTVLRKVLTRNATVSLHKELNSDISLVSLFQRLASRGSPET
jgi:hypothetical protein